MPVNGRDCSIVIKTVCGEIDVPYSEETIREAVSLLVEEAAIEGDGLRRAIRKSGGVTGCVVTPLTIGSAPLLLYLAFGSAGLELLPLEDSDCFDLIQDRTISNEQLAVSNERRLFEGCRVLGFELRIGRGEAVKLKLDVCGDNAPSVYFLEKSTSLSYGQRDVRYHGDFVSYRINGREYSNIYGFTLLSQKEGGTRTEIWIKRALNDKSDFPQLIEELTITANLVRGKGQVFGTFSITAKRLVLMADETSVNSAGAVIGPLRFYVAGSVRAGNRE